MTKQLFARKGIALVLAIALIFTLAMTLAVPAQADVYRQEIKISSGSAWIDLYSDVNIEFYTDTRGTVYYLVQNESDSAPTADDIITNGKSLGKVSKGWVEGEVTVRYPSNKTIYIVVANYGSDYTSISNILALGISDYYSWYRFYSKYIDDDFWGYAPHSFTSDSGAGNRTPFADVNEHWGKAEISTAYEKGLMNGVSAQAFAPDEASTRAMLVTILWRMEGSPAASGSTFTDLTEDWYTDAVNWASTNRIVYGTSATTFSPNAAITREEMVTIFYRYAVYKGAQPMTADLSAYTDTASISQYAQTAMSWAIARGLINGTTSNTIAPQGGATRAQLATSLIRYIGG